MQRKLLVLTVFGVARHDVHRTVAHQQPPWFDNSATRSAPAAPVRDPNALLLVIREFENLEEVRLRLVLDARFGVRHDDSRRVEAGTAADFVHRSESFHPNLLQVAAEPGIAERCEPLFGYEQSDNLVLRDWDPASVADGGPSAFRTLIDLA